MKIKHFKVGDKVRLVKHGRIGWESDEWTKKYKLKLGHIYKVRVADNASIKVVDESPGNWLHPNHFAKVRGKK